MYDRFRGPASRCAVLVVCMSALVTPAGGLSASPPTSAPLPVNLSSYCSHRNAIFGDRHRFVGITDGYVAAGDASNPSYRDCTFGDLAAHHIGYFRGAISWEGVEYAPNQYSFAPYDGLIADLARHHMQFLGGVLETPPWRSTAPQQGARGGIYPPARPSDLGYFMSLCVRRYGPGGTFWRAHPTLPYLPVRAWQIWNEPDLSAYWEPAPNPRAYVAVLRAAYTAIKRVDRHATVVTAGMPFTSASSETTFLGQLYRAGLHRAFDVLAIHPYAATAVGAMQRLLTARQVMNRFGDRRKSMWATEWGWAGGPPNPYIVNPAGQGNIMAAFLKSIQRNRAKLRLGGLFYYSWRDIQGTPPNWWGYNLGLVTKGLTAKPGLAILTAAARRLDRR